MVKVDLKGIKKKRAKGKIYYYAWLGGPRLKGEPGSPEFMASFNEAIQNLKAPDKERFSSIITLYKASRDYKKLADTTKRNWDRWLDRIRDDFGELRISQFERTDKIRPVIRRWRGKYADQPRNADYGKQVLSRVCSYAVDPLGKLTSNPCDGIKNLYSEDRSDIIWEDHHIIMLKETCSEEIGWVVDLASLTGLRQSDLLLLSWSHIGEDAITIATGKGRRQRRVAIVPLYDDLRHLLDRIPKRATTVLTSSRKTPWTSNGFQSSFNDAKINAKMDELDLHFHDLRGTAATKLYIAGIPIRVIAEICGWDEETVEKIIRRYVSRGAATKALIAQINEYRTKSGKPAGKLSGET
jgi:integrase